MEDENLRRRRELCKKLIRSGIIKSKRLAKVCETVPRHIFVPSKLVGDAYTDIPLPIGRGQTISAPHSR